VEGAKVDILMDWNAKAQYVCRVYSGFNGTFETPPRLLGGERYRIRVTTNKEDADSEWHRLNESNQILPDFVVDRKKLGIRGYIDRSAVNK
jgi:hypothetical protein